MLETHYSKNKGIRWNIYTFVHIIFMYLHVCILKIDSVIKHQFDAIESRSL